MSEKIPNKCPLINRCVEYMSEGAFESVCFTESWVDCPLAQTIARRMGYVKLPREWIKELGIDES